MRAHCDRSVAFVADDRHDGRTAAVPSIVGIRVRTLWYIDIGTQRYAWETERLVSKCAKQSSGAMAVAYFTVHQHQGALPIRNGGELAVIYCFVALFIACRGAGKWGVDKG